MRLNARLAFWLILASVAITASAQNIISGELSGIVTDPTGASVAGAQVTLHSTDAGTDQNTTTNQSGSYRFALLRPGDYSVVITAPGFERVTINTAVVTVGRVTSIPTALVIQRGTETIEVASTAPLLETENGNVTATYDRQQIETLPMPGQDMTNYALSAPGVTLSTGAGYGNFTAFGLPGTSNLYTVNGADNNDPFNGLDNSGSSNNTLGTNELQELTIVTNGYTGEYGRAAGANINYSTKSGTNSFHGNGTWWWNGSNMNANDWFNNDTTPKTPRSFANSNQWAGSIGGPIVKDKLFFFFDSEGLRYVLPNATLVYVPTPQFQAATIANLQASSSPGVAQEVPFYQSAFNIYNNAPGVGGAAITNSGADPSLGCGDLAGSPTGLGGTFGVDTPCSASYRSGVNNKNVERLMSVRIDYNVKPSDKLAFRYWQDRGVQPTFTDPLNPIFNATSTQPQDQGQLTYTKVINAHSVNQFIFGGGYYSAVFSPANFNKSVSASPFQAPVSFFDGSPYNNVGGTLYSYPQGRRVSQYQFVDDYSWTKGNHDFKFGANIRHNNFTDLTPFRNTSGRLEVFSMTSFFNGVADRLAQRFENTNEAGFVMYSLGLYAQDEWRVSPKLKLTLSLRADRNSNESCPKGCFSRFAGSFLGISHDPNTPYNASIQTGLKSAFPSLEAVVWEPRVGFAYSLHQSTVFRGGVGLFSDLYPGQMAERYVSNPPYVASFNIDGANIAPGVAGSAFTIAAQSDAALTQGFASGGTLASIRASLPPGGTFNPPTISSASGHMTNPKYLQWNFEMEQGLGSKTSFSVNYVGNHGYDEFIVNPGYNTFCKPSNCPAGFGSLPTSAPDSRFNSVTELTNRAMSNYNGLTTSITRQFTYGFRGQLNYTWSHSLDEVSNGGFDPYSTINANSDSLLVQIDPTNIRRLNYSNSDYDFRHSLSANYSWALPFRANGRILNQVLGGWTIGGTLYARSGAPYSVTDTTVPGGIISNGSATNVLGTYLGGGQAGCDRPNSDPNNPHQCLNASEFAAPGTETSFGNLRRNSFRGPKYFNTDLSLYKGFKVKESVALTFGASAYNVLNHPNFNNPDGNLADGTFGQITSTATPPSSPYGNFQGSAVSGRVLQTMIRLQF